MRYGDDARGQRQIELGELICQYNHSRRKVRVGVFALSFACQEQELLAMEKAGETAMPRGSSRVDKMSPIPIGRKGHSPALVSPQYIIQPRQETKDGGRNRRPVERETWDSPSILAILLGMGRNVLLFQPAVDGDRLAQDILHRYLIDGRNHLGLTHCVRCCTTSMIPHDGTRGTVNH